MNVEKTVLIHQTPCGDRIGLTLIPSHIEVLYHFHLQMSMRIRRTTPQ